jgi:hypothetical protein
MVAIGKLDQRRNQQWLVLHQAQHFLSSDLYFRTVVLFLVDALCQYFLAFSRSPLKNRPMDFPRQSFA